MRKILITRREYVTYSVILDLSDELANSLLENPKSYTKDLDRMCKGTDDNWQDSEDAEFEVEEYTE